MLREDHRAVSKLFDRYTEAGERAFTAKRELVERMVRALSMHAAIEEEIFYPAVRRSVAGATDIVLESLEEHHIVKWMLSELEASTPRTSASTPRCG